jgi:SAM-dependent methyltransferase
VDACRVFADRYVAIRSLKANGVVGEVGTQTGRFAAYIDETSRPRELHLFDLSMDAFEVPALTSGANARRVFFHVGDSSTELAQFPRHHFDWLYIDGDHSYAGVQRDIAAAVRVLKPDGMLVFNDYTTWSPAEVCAYGVLRAVNELLNGGGWEMLYIALEPMGYHDVALRRVSEPDHALLESKNAGGGT